jgi:hypothetical protein
MKTVESKNYLFGGKRVRRMQSFTLSEDAAESLAKQARIAGVNKSRYLERLIVNANDMLSFHKRKGVRG